MKKKTKKAVNPSSTIKKLKLEIAVLEKAINQLSEDKETLSGNVDYYRKAFTIERGNNSKNKHEILIMQAAIEFYKRELQNR
jgi:hypothetical protein